MRLLPGILPGKLPILAGLAAATGFTVLLAATAAVYVAVDLLGALMMAAFLLAAMGLAASGWLAYLRALAPPSAAARPSSPDSGLHRLLEAVAGEVKLSAGTIGGFAEVIAAAPGTGDARPCRQLLDSSRRLTAFASDLHDYIRCERGRLRLSEQQVDAGELVTAALASCRAETERSGLVVVADVFDRVEVTCDSRRIGRAIASLVTWAAGEAARGTVMDVRLVRLADGALAIDIATRGQAPAKPVPEADRLFEPQLRHGGLEGLGLPIARQVALLHAGEVTAGAEAGQGRAARLTLPAARVAWPEADHQPAARAA